MNANLTIQPAPAVLPDLDIEGILQLYMADLDASPKTKASYRRSVGNYLLWADCQGRTGLARADVLAYRDMLMQSYAPSTVGAYLSGVRSFLSWADATYGTGDPGRAVKSPKRDRSPRRDPLTTDQARRVLDAIDTSTIKGARDYAVVSLGIHTGLRCMEIAGATVGDIRNVGNRTVLFVQGKGRDSKDDYVVLVPEVLDAIYRYLGMRGDADPDSPLIASVADKSRGGPVDRKAVSRIVKERFQAVGLDSDRLTAHSLRHTAVTFALMGGASIQQVQAMARHADPKTTMIYAHNLERLTCPAESAISDVLGARE